MKTVDWVILAGIALAVGIAVFILIRNRKKGKGCGCCDGNCENCRKR